MQASVAPERKCLFCRETFLPPTRGRGYASQGFATYCSLSCRSKHTAERRNRERHADPMAAITAKVAITADGCWQWTGFIGTHGYGTLTYKSERLLAHRLAYETAREPIPTDKVIDHLCRNRWCVNPDHLEVVAQQVNVHRGAAGPTQFCKRGHERTAENTISRKNGERQCRVCRRLTRSHICKGRAQSAKEKRTA